MQHSTYGKCAKGTHIVESWIRIDPTYSPPQEYLNEELKAKIITYFYGNILKELDKFRFKHATDFDHNVLYDLNTIIDKIIKGELADENALEP